MAKQVIGIGTTANDGTGDPLREAMDKTNDNFTELYAGAGGVADGAITTAKLATDAVDSAKIADGAVDTVHIADNNVTYAKLGIEYTETVALGSGVAINWDSGSTFTKTLSADAILSFSNAKTGMQINLVISGNHALTLPSSVKELTNAATYDGSGENLISIVSTNGNTEQFATINKVA